MAVNATCANEVFINIIVLRFYSVTAMDGFVSTTSVQISSQTGFSFVSSPPFFISDIHGKPSILAAISYPNLVLLGHRRSLPMETAGEERDRASQSLRHLEEAAVLLGDASKEQAPDKVSPGFPERVAAILNSLTTISSREDAERLLAIGKLHATFRCSTLTIKHKENLTVGCPLSFKRCFYVECRHCVRGMRAVCKYHRSPGEGPACCC